MSKSSKVKKTKPVVVSMLEDPNLIQGTLEALDQCIIGIDQALDNTGITVLHPDGKHLMSCIQDVIHSNGLTTKEVGEWTQLRKGRAHWGAYLFHNGKGILVYCKEYAPSNEPEWKICKENAEHLLSDIELLIGECKTTIVIESLVIQGVAGSIAILAILGMLYAALFEKLLEYGDQKGHKVGEIGNGTWKKVISGAGNTPKKNVQTAWRGITSIPFSDDETDSISIAFSSAFDLYFNKEPATVIKYSKGRIRPPSKEAK